MPMTAIHSRLTMEKETPSLPPANIVPVKKVKLNNTMAMENTPLRPAAGASTRGKSLLFDILEPLAGRWAVIAGSSKRCARKNRARGIARGVQHAQLLKDPGGVMPFYCASCQVLHQSRAEEGGERIPGAGGEF